jgi:hypothetical protein
MRVVAERLDGTRGFFVKNRRQGKSEMRRIDLDLN